MGKPSLVFATNNAHKLREMRQLVGDSIELLSLADIGCKEELPETSDTIKGNAIQKATYVSEHYGVDCMADDTGLEVEALGGAPGVHTARYASAEGHDSRSNMELLLHNLRDAVNRNARFVTVIAHVQVKGTTQCYEGICNGTIATEPRGTAGFGYDPVFIPEGQPLTFAQMDDSQKNAVSHRGRASRLFADSFIKR